MADRSMRVMMIVPFLIAACFTTVHSRSLLAPTPAPAPAPGTSYTVPNWRNGVAVANATLPVGGTIIIPWQGNHGVYQTASYACQSSYPTPNPNGLVSAVGNGGSFQTTFNTAGTYYFVCQVGQHCSQGQLIAVTVS